MIADDKKNANRVLQLFLTSSSQVCTAKLCPGSLPGGCGQLGRDAMSLQEKRMLCGRPLGPPAWPYGDGALAADGLPPWARLLQPERSPSYETKKSGGSSQSQELKEVGESSAQSVNICF